MSSPPHLERSTAIRAVISEFLQQRLTTKLEELDKNIKFQNVEELRNERGAALVIKFGLNAWLENAAGRAHGIQMATHTIKAIHPRARGSNFLAVPKDMRQLDAVGSHILGDNFRHDAAANAADLDVFAFLKLSPFGTSFLNLCLARDAVFGAALSDKQEVAESLMSGFSQVAEVSEKPATHRLAKQLYWCVGDDPLDDSQFHILAPLYPSSLVEVVYASLQTDLFGEDATAARDAKRKGKIHQTPTKSYPNLVKQTIGGSTRKAQNNVSDLNGSRRGANYLLSSLPPVWQSVAVQPLWGVDSLFKALRRRKGVGGLLKRLKQFLSSDPARNAETRAHRDELVEDLLDELLAFAAGIQALPPGWTADHRCELPRSHMAWLDPQGDEAIPGDLLDQLAGDFALWLNDQFRPAVILGDAEYHHWRAQARELFKAWEREGLNEFA